VSETKILDGRGPAAVIRAELAARVRALGRAPKLAIVRVGEDPRSTAYIERKVAFGQEIGAEVAVVTLPSASGQSALEAATATAASDPSVDGVIVQLPAGELDGYGAAALLPPEKDVDGLVPGSAFTPATALAVARLLDAHGIALGGKRVAVVGQSRLVGKPFAALARERGATVSTADISTLDLATVTRPAEVVVVAVGKPRLLGPEHLAAGAAVVDVGTTVDAEGKVWGDVDPGAYGQLAAYSPVPGGVGPMTVAALFQNLLLAAERRIDIVK
jgi:methylenetetrahydrofolate dehydrogenase (NADP+)/methenyltetrahydrofolate cyclohydrolase